MTLGGVVQQWLARLPHSKKVLGSFPAHASMIFLFLPTIQKPSSKLPEMIIMNGMRVLSGTVHAVATPLTQ